MKLWTSSETFKNIGHEKTKLLNLFIESKVNELIKNKNYGDSIDQWNYIAISMPQDLLPPEYFSEIKKYNKKEKEVEFRLKIDNNSLSSANNDESVSLFSKSILDSIDLAEKELKIPNFNFDEFRKDLTELFKKEGWI